MAGPAWARERKAGRKGRRKGRKRRGFAWFSVGRRRFAFLGFGIKW